MINHRPILCSLIFLLQSGKEAKEDRKYENQMSLKTLDDKIYQEVPELDSLLSPTKSVTQGSPYQTSSQAHMYAIVPDPQGLAGGKDKQASAVIHQAGSVPARSRSAAGRTGQSPPVVDEAGYLVPHTVMMTTTEPFRTVLDAQLQEDPLPEVPQQDSGKGITKPAVPKSSHVKGPDSSKEPGQTYSEIEHVYFGQHEGLTGDKLPSPGSPSYAKMLGPESLKSGLKCPGSPGYTNMPGQEPQTSGRDAGDSKALQHIYYEAKSNPAHHRYDEVKRSSNSPDYMPVLPESP